MKSQGSSSFPALINAAIRLNSIAKDNNFPELQVAILNLANKTDRFARDGERDNDAVAALEQSVTEIYRTSVAQANAAPQKYQQPIFQCYSDYEACASTSADRSKKAICLAMFILSLVDNLTSISLTIK